MHFVTSPSFFIGKWCHYIQSVEEEDHYIFTTKFNALLFIPLNEFWSIYQRIVVSARGEKANLAYKKVVWSHTSCIDHEVRWPGFELHHSYFLTMRPWTGYVASLNYLTHEIITIHISWGYWDHKWHGDNTWVSIWLRKFSKVAVIIVVLYCCCFHYYQEFLTCRSHGLSKSSKCYLLIDWFSENRWQQTET